MVVSLKLLPEKKYAVKDVVAGMEYEFRVTAINLSGVGESSNPSEFVFARDPKSKYCNCFPAKHPTINDRLRKNIFMYIS